MQAECSCKVLWIDQLLLYKHLVCTCCVWGRVLSMGTSSEHKPHRKWSSEFYDVAQRISRWSSDIPWCSSPVSDLGYREEYRRGRQHSMKACLWESLALSRWLKIQTESQRNKLWTKVDQILQNFTGKKLRETRHGNAVCNPPLDRLWQEDQYFLASLGCIAKPWVCLFLINKRCGQEEPDFWISRVIMGH